MKRIAIVTGASSGLGKEFAKQISGFCDLDEIWIIARRKEKLDELAKEINSSKNFDIVKPIQLDLSKRENLYQFQKLLQEESLKLHSIESKLEVAILINNAGFGTYGPFEETPLEKEIEMVDLNCTAITALCGYAIPYMNKGGLIINTASLAAVLPLGNFAVYGATKSFVLSLSIALKAELKDKGIKVCALCPGPVSTEFANVASNGAREEVKHGLDAVKVVAHCLKNALNDKGMAIMAFKWKFKAFASRFVDRYFGARFMYKFCKRPYKHEEKTEETVDLSDFI